MIARNTEGNCALWWGERIAEGRAQGMSMSRTILFYTWQNLQGRSFFKGNDAHDAFRSVAVHRKLSHSFSTLAFMDTHVDIVIAPR